MKKVLALMLALVLVLSLVACGNKIPEGTYKMTYDSNPSNQIFLDITTLEVKSDGSATLSVDLGSLGVDTTDVTFDTDNGTVSYDQSEAKYSVEGNRITFLFDNGIEKRFEKQ